MKPVKITLKPVDAANRALIRDLFPRDDQPFVPWNGAVLRAAEDHNEDHPGTARPFAVCAGDRTVGFALLLFDEEADDPERRFQLWHFMIDERYQGRGWGQAALAEIIRWFRRNGADRIILSADPENEAALHIYHKAGFRETWEMNGDRIILKLTLA